MPDPIEGVLDDIDPAAPPQADPPAVAADENKVAIDREELERLQQVAAQFNDVAPTLQMLRDNPGLIHDLRARAVDAAVGAPNVEDTNAAFYVDPTAQATRIAQQEAAKMSYRSNQQVGNMMINQFLQGKQSSEFYHVCTPIFNKLIENLDRAGLSQQDQNQVQFILNAAWNSAVGEYSQKRLADRKKNPPANLGGGSSGGGGGATPVKRTLAEINPALYRQAKEAGLSEDDMAEIVASIEGND